MKKIIAVDFDGTLVDHRYPDIGEEAPEAIQVCQELNAAGVYLILSTMRSGEELQQAVAWCKANNIKLWDANKNPEQSSWTSSPKVYAQRYIGDDALGCPLIRIHNFHRPCADWRALRLLLIEEGFLTKPKQ
jgi:hypothetical protein